MRIFLIVLSYVFLTSCSVHHHHYVGNDDKYVQYEVVKHSYINKNDYIIVVINHRNKLKKHQKKRLKRWCHNHYRHHNKKIKYKFVLN